MSALKLGTSLALAAAFVSGTVFAQPSPVAKLKDLGGTVLVSQGDAMTAGAAGQAVRPGTRVVTSAGSKVTIAYDKGCDVRLQENQRFTVREFGECGALIASVESTGVVGAAVVGGGGAAAGAGGTIALVAGVAIAGGVTYDAIHESQKDRSPN